MDAWRTNTTTRERIRDAEFVFRDSDRSSSDRHLNCSISANLLPLIANRPVSPDLRIWVDSDFDGVLSSPEIEELHVLERFLRPRRACLGGAVIDDYKKNGHLYLVR